MIYDMSQEGSLAGDFGLKDQIQRASVSIMSHLAEGFDRTIQAEKPQYYPLPRRQPGKCAASSAFWEAENSPRMVP